MKGVFLLAAALILAAAAAAAVTALPDLKKTVIARQPARLPEGGKIDPRLPLFFKTPDVLQRSAETARRFNAGE